MKQKEYNICILGHSKNETDLNEHYFNVHNFNVRKNSKSSKVKSI